MKHILILPDGKETNKMELNEIKKHLDENYPLWVRGIMVTCNKFRNNIVAWIPIWYVTHPDFLFLEDFR